MQQQAQGGARRTRIWLVCLLLPVLTAGCVAAKLNGLDEIIQANPRGWDDAVNGSFYKDGGSDSERIMRSLGLYINQLEEQIERGN